MSARRYLAWLSPRFLLRAILMLDGSPHTIALGTAIGMFVALTPTVGIQMLIVLAIAFLVRPFFRFNKMAALITVYVSNPLTVVPLYWFNYKVGTIFLPETVTHERFRTLLRGPASWGDWWAGLFTRTWTLMVEVGGPLIVGSLVVATVAALSTYLVMNRVMEQVRRRRDKRRIARQARKQRKQEMKAVALPEGVRASSRL